MRVALYARVSTRDKGQETENQLRQLRDFAIHSGWTIVAEYIDHESGKVSDRAEFQRMFEDASRRQFDVLLFWSLDRLSREGATLLLPTCYEGNLAQEAVCATRGSLCVVETGRIATAIRPDSLSRSQPRSLISSQFCIARTTTA